MEDFVQPVLTSNGIMGGSSFAVSKDSSFPDYYAYTAFDGNDSGWGCLFATNDGYLEFYNPDALIVTSLTISNYGGDSHGVRAISSGYVQACNDGVSYKTIKEFTNDVLTGSASWSIDLSDNNTPYRYYRIFSTASNYAYNGTPHQSIIRELKITATVGGGL